MTHLRVLPGLRLASANSPRQKLRRILGSRLARGTFLTSPAIMNERNQSPKVRLLGQESAGTTLRRIKQSRLAPSTLPGHNDYPAPASRSTKRSRTNLLKQTKAADERGQLPHLPLAQLLHWRWPRCPRGNSADRVRLWHRCCCGWQLVGQESAVLRGLVDWACFLQMERRPAPPVDVLLCGIVTCEPRTLAGGPAGW